MSQGLPIGLSCAAGREFADQVNGVGQLEPFEVIGCPGLEYGWRGLLSGAKNNRQMKCFASGRILNAERHRRHGGNIW